MNGIYDRDNINYTGMIGNMLQSRIDSLNREQKRIQDYNQTLQSGLQMAGRAYDAYRADEKRKELLERLDALKAKKESILNAERTWNDPAGAFGIAQQVNPYATPNNFDANQSDYFKYLLAMNGVI